MKKPLFELALAILRGDEGVRKHPYDDATGKRVRAPVGNVTIGCGINLDEGLDDYLIDIMERHLLHVNLLALEHRLRTEDVEFGATPIVLADEPDKVQLALALMVFQLGPDRVMRFARMLNAISGHDYAAAAKEALDSKWARETAPRAERVAKLFRECAA